MIIWDPNYQPKWEHWTRHPPTLLVPAMCMWHVGQISKSYQLCKIVFGFGGGMCYWVLPLFSSSAGYARHCWWIAVLLRVLRSQLVFTTWDVNFLCHLTIWRCSNVFRIKNCPPKNSKCIEKQADLRKDNYCVSENIIPIFKPKFSGTCKSVCRK